MIKLNIPEVIETKNRGEIRQTISLIERVIEDTMYPLLEEACCSPSATSVLAILRNHENLDVSLIKRAIVSLALLLDHASKEINVDRQTAGINNIREFIAIAATMGFSDGNKGVGSRYETDPEFCEQVNTILTVLQ
jgi:hypothetical protein